MIEQKLVAECVETLLEAEYPAHYIVEVAVHPGNRIVVELGCDQGVGIDECVRISKHIESQFDREVEDYELEVGSAGITSPMRVLRQYQSAVESEVEVLCRGGIKLRGQLLAASEEGIVVEIIRRVKPEGAKRKVDVVESLTLSYGDILQCKRVFNF